MIRKSDDNYVSNIEFCNGADASIVSSTSCAIPLVTLRAQPFNLVLGNPVNAKVSAINFYGTSGYSNFASGAYI